MILTREEIERIRDDLQGAPGPLTPFGQQLVALAHTALYWMVEAERLREALDRAFPIVRKAAVAAKMDAVNASPSDPTALQREAWMKTTDDALSAVVSARATEARND